MKIHAVYSLVFFFIIGGCVTQKSAVVEKTTVQERVETGGENHIELTTEEREADVLPELAEEKETPIAYTEAIDETKESVSIIQVIQSLEESYEKNDFEGWKSFLTPKYREKYNDPEFLRNEGWNATDIESFFKLLIDTRKKGSIKALQISRVEFIHPNKALVYVLFGEEEFPEPQHTFIKIDNKWYKGLIEEGE